MYFVYSKLSMDYQQLWNSSLSQIELELSKANYQTWFQKTKIINYKDGDVTIGVPSDFVKEWLKSRYEKLILRVLRSVHEGVRSVSFSVVKPDALQRRAQNVPIGENTLPLDNHSINKDDGLNPKYTFNNFTVAEFNQIAWSASQAIIENPGSQYNPLFIYGSPGLGKTHLMQAIGNAVKKKYPDRKVFYTSLEKYYIEYINAISQNKVSSFKERYYKYDVFIMDDIQFINNKEKTQDELFHLFNRLYESNKQIIFSSDKHPNLIQGLEERLRSRFNQGMISDVQTPGREARVAILKQKTREVSHIIEEEVLEFIADNVQGSIRDLEGAAVLIMMHTQTKNQALSVNEVKNLLKNSVNKRRTVSVPEVVKLISDFYRIPESHIYNKTRRKDVVKPRQIIMYVLREDFDISYPMIGEKMGGRDHTTVIHSYEKIKAELKNNSILSKEIDEIRQIFG